MIRSGAAILVALALTLFGCGGRDRGTFADDYANNHAGETADDEPLEFHGYECTDDCGGHEAGYQWANDHGITDPDSCGGRSQSFIEGCRAYAEENGY